MVSGEKEATMSMRFTLFLAVLGLLTAPAPAQPVEVKKPPAVVLDNPAGPPTEETYTIKIKESARGDRTLAESQETEQSHARLLYPDGETAEDNREKKTVTLKCRQTILELPDAQKLPTRLRRQYDKARVTSDGNQQTLPYEGKTVLIEKKDGKYRFQIEGGDELTGKDAELLDKEFSHEKDEKVEMEKILLPRRPVRVNETWKIDPEAFIQAMAKGPEGGLSVDAARAVATGKLSRAYQKDGRQFGVLEFRLDLPLKDTVGKEKLALEPGARMTVQIKLDGCIDGQANDAVVDLATQLDLTATIKMPDGQNYKLVVTAANSHKETQKDLPKE
jgi:hypothetical protein